MLVLAIFWSRGYKTSQKYSKIFSFNMYVGKVHNMQTFVLGLFLQVYAHQVISEEMASYMFFDLEQSQILVDLSHHRVLSSYVQRWERI